MRYLILIILFFLFGCNVLIKPTVNENSVKELYINEFKLVYFEELLKKGFNSDKGYLQAVSIDRSNFTEPILNGDDWKLIDSLTIKENEKMVADSLHSFFNRAEGAVGKIVFKYALERYNSKWLDSVARARYKNAAHIRYKRLSIE